MATIRQILNVLTAEEIQQILDIPEVAVARATLEAGGSVAYFSLSLPTELRAKVASALGLPEATLSSVPMRWIRGDTRPHVDRGAAFDATYLMYLNSSEGELRLGEASYPIAQGTAYVFQEGIRHETVNTGSEPRLLLGPMSEAGIPVGANMFYFFTEADALTLNYTNSFGNSNSYTVGDSVSGPITPYTSWRLASNSSGTSSQLAVYPNGSVLNSDGSYYLYPAIPCLLEGTKVLCLVGTEEEYVPIEKLQKGALVKTARDGYKPLAILGKGTIQNPGTAERVESRLYRCRREYYEELKEDLILTGCHSLLVKELTEEQREATKKSLGQIFVTDKLYRLMAWLDDRAEPWVAEGEHPIWHLALEHDDEAMNYGIYVNGGLLVETCCLRFMRLKSNMTFVEN